MISKGEGLGHWLLEVMRLELNWLSSFICSVIWPSVARRGEHRVAGSHWGWLHIHFWILTGHAISLWDHGCWPTEHSIGRMPPPDEATWDLDLLFLEDAVFRVCNKWSYRRRCTCEPWVPLLHSWETDQWGPWWPAALEVQKPWYGAGKRCFLSGLSPETPGLSGMKESTEQRSSQAYLDFWATKAVGHNLVFFFS